MISRVRISGGQPPPPPDTVCLSQITLGVAANADGEMTVAGVNAQVVLSAALPTGLQPLGQSQLELKLGQLTAEDQRLLDSVIEWAVGKYIAAQGGAVQRVQES